MDMRKWFKEAQYGMMAHWGLYSLLGGEWRAFLHEIDHLDGHLYPEIAEKMLTAEELEEMLKQEEDAIEAEGEDE